MGALTKIKAAGFKLSIVTGGLMVSPSSKLSEAQRDFIKRNKLQLIRELAANDAESAKAGIQQAEAAIVRWLHYISVNRADLITEVLDKCRTNPEAMAYYLKCSREINL